MIVTNENIKQVAVQMGAQCCAIAPVKRFQDAPEGFHPKDIYTGAKSVVVIALRIPEGVFSLTSPVAYTAVNDCLLNKVLTIACEMSIIFAREYGVTAVPIPSEPYEYWDDQKRIGKGLLSLKHAGFLAGLGSIGRNSLLTHPVYGNRLVLGAVLLDIDLKGDPVIQYQFCSDACRQCIKGCPSGAIDNGSVNQRKCRNVSGVTTQKGYFIYVCNNCRRICPHGAGFETCANNRP